MHLPSSVLQALRVGVTTGGVACALTVGCGASAHPETTPQPAHVVLQEPAAEPVAAPTSRPPATTIVVTNTSTNTNTTTTTEEVTPPVNPTPPIEPEYDAMVACGRG